MRTFGAFQGEYATCLPLANTAGVIINNVLLSL